jgi:coenzyme F420-reducing hydrogenase delta subunit
MEIRNPFTLLRDLSRKPATLPSSVLDSPDLSKEEKELIRRVGLTNQQLRQDLQESTSIQWDRQRLYHEINRSLEHWLVAAATRLYADYATVQSPIHNATVWITSENKKYYKVLSKLLDDISIEEKIFDWAWTVAAYGDLFIGVEGRPTLGVVTINDDKHPVQISRVDHEGILVGFVETQSQTSVQKMIPPWEYVHLRILGAKRKRPVFSDPLYSEFRTMSLMTGTNTRQVTSKYGASLLIDSLPTYKRLRLAEDSILLARMTRGITRYIWKLAINHTNMEAVNEIVDQIGMTLKRARALNTSSTNPNYDSKENPMGVTEDIFMPVWGDNTNNLTFDEIGGKPDIRWIVDVDALRNQLACTLRTPIQLLGGYVDEASGALGSEAIEKLDVGFARNARRLQRSLKEGIKRICQIHLSYMNMDPDPALFNVNMSETSTAEEEVIKNTFETGVTIIDQVMDILDKVDPSLDKKKVFDYMNKKILKLEGFDLANFRKDIVVEKIATSDVPKKVTEEFKRYPITNSDLVAYLPLVTRTIKENGKAKKIYVKLSERSTILFTKRWQSDWEKKYSTTTVSECKGGRPAEHQMTFAQLREKKEVEVKERQDQQLEVEV